MPNGIPVSVYLAKHTIYKSPAKSSIEDEINGTEPTLQAKGRIERMLRTFLNWFDI